VEQCTCMTEMPSHGTRCYMAQCYATTRLLSGKAGIQAGRFSTSFQSRLSKNWMSPFTDDRLKELAAAGKRRVLVVPASFVADCLETTLEIGTEYRELFLEEGGDELVMVESLNSSDRWVEAVRGMFSQ
jgi:protoporphyrin/coproporphyrin ferrochelatase